MGKPYTRARAVVAAGLAPLTVAAAVLLGAPPAQAVADEEALPTAQLDGVAWSQVIVGDTVYVGGQFSRARPAGAALGENDRVRQDFLAYNLTTGELTDWRPRSNGVVKALAASPDGRTIYAVGSFTEVNGVKRSRIAAIDASSGELVPGFKPTLNGNGLAVAATDGTVYVGGKFTSANGATRTRAAAFNAKTGALRAFKPSIDQDVLAIVVKGGSVVIGGRFAKVNGETQRGTQRVDAETGKKNLRWDLNSVVGNNGPESAIWSLSSRGDYVYGTGYNYQANTKGKKLEGAFVARWDSGKIRWIEDCHGDTYSIAATDDSVYIAGHPHYCGNLPNGFGETKPNYFRALAFTSDARGILKHNDHGNYSDFGGQPAPFVRSWRPSISQGTFTGTNQGPWSVVAGSGYVAYAGEFVRVNGKAQQGLVRLKDN